MLQVQYQWTVAAMSQKFQKQVLPKNEILLQKEQIISWSRLKSLDFWESLRESLFINAYTWPLAMIYDIVLMFRYVFHKGLT